MLWFPIIVFGYLMTTFNKGCEGSHERFLTPRSSSRNNKKIDEIMNRVRAAKNTVKEKTERMDRTPTPGMQTAELNGKNIVPKPITTKITGTTSDETTDADVVKGSSVENVKLVREPKIAPQPFIDTSARASGRSKDLRSNLYSPPAYESRVQKENRFKSDAFSDISNSNKMGKDWLNKNNYDMGYSQSNAPSPQSSGVERGCNVGSRVLLVGDQWTEKGICGIFTCQVHQTRNLKTDCPALTYHEGSECVVSEQNVDLDFPHCCPKLNCNTAASNSNIK